MSNEWAKVYWSYVNTTWKEHGNGHCDVVLLKDTDLLNLRDVDVQKIKDGVLSAINNRQEVENLTYGRTYDFTFHISLNTADSPRMSVSARIEYKVDDCEFLGVTFLGKG